MASSLLLLLDDIASMMDDVATMTKVAVRKTTGVLGDDLALNAKQVTGITAERELPVVWAVAKGSLLNKAILVPLALLISAIAPWLITPLMMLGGAYLCFEGVEKLVHKFLHQDDHADSAESQPVLDQQTFEKETIKGAVRTDFILSAEIIVLSLGSTANASFQTQVLTLLAIAPIMTIGVYGVVAALVKLDDIGLHLTHKRSRMMRRIGVIMLRSVPWLMRGLTIAGTLAMFLVGGGILAHGIAPLVAWLHAIELSWNGIFASITTMAANFAVGIITGSIVLAIVTLIQKMRPSK